MFENTQFGIKQVGIILIILGLLSFFVTLSYADRVNQQHSQECTLLQEGQCPFGGFIITMEGYAGFTISLILVVLGFYLIFRADKTEAHAKMTREEKQGILRKLGPKEAGIYELINKSGGTLFQSEIVEKSGDTKVNITRILDRLEGKGLIERKRRGMSNVVILKY
jgi:uncharacterized membrane protein